MPDELPPTDGGESPRATLDSPPPAATTVTAKKRKKKQKALEWTETLMIGDCSNHYAMSQLKRIQREWRDGGLIR